jgi:predicted HTH transcriptional regulator
MNLAELIKKGEGEKLDFKQTISNSQKIAKILSAFSNTKGGVLLVGIKDNGSPAKINPSEEQYMLEMAAGLHCKPEIPISFEEVEYLGRTILVAKIEESHQKPHCAKGDDGKWWAYIRVHDQCLLASKVMLDVMRNNTQETDAQITYDKEEKALLDYLNAYDRITLKQYCKMANLSRWRAQRILVNLVRMGIIKVISTEQVDFYSI